ncbi:MAG: hypothetical protein ACTSSP_11510 [Candidatus Asgardarchaeia archaeon]
MIDLEELKKYLISDKERIEKCLKRDLEQHKKFEEQDGDHYTGWMKRISIPVWEEQLKWAIETIEAIKELEESREAIKMYMEQLNVHDDDGNPCTHSEPCNCHWTDPRPWEQQLKDIEIHIEMLIEPETLEKIGADKIEHRDLPFRIMRILAYCNDLEEKEKKQCQ